MIQFTIQQNGDYMKKKVFAFLQARTDSSRLPKKVLNNLLNYPMIIHQLQRVSRSKLIDRIVLLTSNETSDDTLVNTVQSYGFDTFRGDKDNVLQRFYDCVNYINAKDTDIIVRLTGDCPLHDSIIIDESIQAFLDQSCDYLANCIEPIYPDGFDTEVFSVKVLKNTFHRALKDSQKEHVTPYIRDSGEFNTCNLKKTPLYPSWRLTVDELEDFKLIEIIYNHFKNNLFSFKDIVDFIEHNQKLLHINGTIKRNEGYEYSLHKESNNAG